MRGLLRGGGELNMINHRKISNNIRKILEASDLSELPPHVVSSIEKEVRKGAKDIDLPWANALELVHASYTAAGAERPIPNMAAAWKQYEQFIQLAVSQLAKHRGISGEWRSISPSLV